MDAGSYNISILNKYAQPNNDTMLVLWWVIIFDMVLHVAKLLTYRIVFELEYFFVETVSLKIDVGVNND